MLKVDTYLLEVVFGSAPLRFSYRLPIQRAVTQIVSPPHFGQAQNKLCLCMLTGMVYINYPKLGRGHVPNNMY